MILAIAFMSFGPKSDPKKKTVPKAKTIILPDCALMQTSDTLFLSSNIAGDTITVYSYKKIIAGSGFKTEDLYVIRDRSKK